MRYLEDCKKRRVIFFTGKGGVGKSTMAWATALACHRQGLKVCVANWNPVEAFENPLGALNPQIPAVSIESMAAFHEYVIRFFKFELLYQAVFENPVFRTFVRAAPGLSETVVIGKVWDLYARGKQDLLIVDLPSSGHALSLFESPLGIQKIFGVGFVHKEAGQIIKMFSSPDARLDLVAAPSELPLTEAGQLKEKLSQLHPFRFGYLHLNSCLPELAPPVGIEGPRAVKTYVDRYQVEHSEQREAFAAAENLGLDPLRTPRFTEGTTQYLLDRVARHLESA